MRREIDARPVAILLEGLPDSLKCEETAYAVEVYVKTRLYIRHWRKILPCIGLMCGDPKEVVTIHIVDEVSSEDLRRWMASYAQESLRLQCNERGMRPPPFEFNL